MMPADELWRSQQALATLILTRVPRRGIPTFPSKNGRIAYASYDAPFPDGDLEIYTINARGGGKSRVTNARSGDIFGERQVLMMWATEGRAHPLDQLVSTQQSLRFDDAPLAVRPLGLYGIQPRALLGQVAAYDP